MRVHDDAPYKWLPAQLDRKRQKRRSCHEQAQPCSVRGLIDRSCPPSWLLPSRSLLLLSFLMFSAPITSRILPATSRLVSNRLPLLPSSRTSLYNRVPRFQSTQNIFRNIATMASPTVKLNSGYDMPLVGFGLWKVDNETCADTVYNAIKAGYRLLDGACGTFVTDLSSQRENTRKRHQRVVVDVEAQREWMKWSGSRVPLHPPHHR